MLQVLKSFFRRFGNLSSIFYGLVLLCGAVFTTSVEPVLRIIVAIGALVLVLMEVKRIKNTDFEEKKMLDEYEKLFLNQAISIEEIDDIMTKKYGDRYKRFSEKSKNKKLDM